MNHRPNIVLITTDQQRFDAIHAAGNTSIFTPHLNWLCDTGIRFSRAYSDCPLCMPARATIMTGLPAYRHGSVGNDQSEPMRARPTLASYLTAAGYETRAQGKMHFEPMRNKFGFETMELSHDYYRQRQQTQPARCGAQHGQGQNEMEPVLGSVSSNETLTRWVVDRSIDFLDTRDPERPFFLWSSISKPHPPFDPSPEFWEIYRDMPMPEVVKGDWSQDFDMIPVGFRQPTAHLNSAHRFSREQLIRIRRAYYACITEIDTTLGRLFTALRERGLLKNTLILFTSDHGEMLGDHGLGGKSLFLEPSAHVPLLVRPPGEWDTDPRRGTVDHRLTCLADLLPTCLNAAGITATPPPEASGINLLDSSAGRSAVIGQCGKTFAVIEERWKYTCTTLGHGELLFDVLADPLEKNNLAARHPEQCSRMRSLLIEELRAAGSPQIAADGSLIQHPEPSFEDIRRWTAWPGFHSNTSTTDLLH